LFKQYIKFSRQACLVLPDVSGCGRHGGMKQHPQVEFQHINCSV
jgi:hypothetical protein